MGTLAVPGHERRTSGVLEVHKYDLIRM